MAEARGKAQADSLRATRAGTTARKLVEGPTVSETIVDSTHCGPATWSGSKAARSCPATAR